MDIDVVVLWVDGNDPNWQEEKNKYSPKKTDENDSVNRYRDWGLLPFWFRTIEKNMPWVRKIHFVTWGHIPKFLNTESDKINIVKHSDFIPEEYLPTFSSHSIELNLHRIPDLAEHFVYFNDDTYLLRKMQPEDFFKDGLPCTYGGEVPIELYGHLGTWQYAATNDLGIINSNFCKKDAVASYGKKYIDKSYRWKDNVRTFLIEKLYPDYFTGFKNLHAPAAYLKSTFEDVWRSEPDKLNDTCLNKFRTNEDVNQWVMLWWQVASGQFNPKVIDNLVVGANDDTVDIIEKCIVNKEHDYICINDPDDLQNFEDISTRIKNSFEKTFPEKSCFEK